MFASPYIAQLDSLRAFAVGAVLVHHYAWTYFGQSFGGVARAGVQLFFVLSGFQITGILLRFEPNFAHFCSLSVEEQFYVAWPWLMLVCPRQYLLAMAIAAIAAAPLYRLGSVLGVPMTGGLGAYISTPACLDALGAGSILALLSSESPPPPWVMPAGRIAVATAVTVCLVTAAGVWENFSVVLYDTSRTVLFAWLIHANSRVSTGIAASLLGLRCLRYVGRISYGIYVYHPFIPGLLAALAAWAGIDHWFAGWSGVAASTALTLLIASLSWHLFEKPINALKRHFDQPLPPGIDRSTPV